MEALVDRPRPGAIALALALSLVSSPFVAASLLMPPTEAATVGWRSMGLPSALLLALLAVLPAGLVGGAIGGRFLGARPVLAVFISIVLAWPIAIAILPIAAAALDINLRAGFYCANLCTAALTDADPLSGPSAYYLSVVFGAFTGIRLLGLGLLGAAWLTSRGGHVPRRIAMVIAGYGALHWASVREGFIPFICLSVGLVVWWYLAARRGTGPRSIRPVEVIR